MHLPPQPPSLAVSIAELESQAENKNKILLEYTGTFHHNLIIIMTICLEQFF